MLVDQLSTNFTGFDNFNLKQKRQTVCRNPLTVLKLQTLMEQKLLTTGNPSIL